MKQAVKYHGKQDHGNLSHMKSSWGILKSERSSCKTGPKYGKQEENRGNCSNMKSKRRMLKSKR